MASPTFNRRGISPVIATLLLVIIAIICSVLAGTLSSDMVDRAIKEILKMIEEASKR